MAAILEVSGLKKSYKNFELKKCQLFNRRRLYNWVYWCKWCR